MTGVFQAIVLAAVTALPFTPPAGWTALPASLLGAQVSNVWQGPKTAHGGQTFVAMTFPFPGTVEMLAANGLGVKSPVKNISSVNTKLCGTPARIVTNQLKSGPKNLIQREVAVKNNRAYMLMYTRPPGVQADPHILHVMHVFCPSGTDQMPAMTVPAGWKKSNTQMRMVGTWLGTQPGEMMTLMQGSQMSSLEKAFASATQHTIKNKQGPSKVSVGNQKSVSMCGYPGMLAEVRVNAGPMPVTMHFAATQGLGKSYVLMYMQTGTAAADPAAMAALNGLCVAGASPAPSATPSAAPSALPSAAPSPAPASTP